MCDGYMCDLSGAESGKVLPTAARNTFFEGQKGPGAPQDVLQRSEPGRFLGLFLCENVYEGDFGSLWDHFGIIVESLWVYEVPFSKNNHFPK